MQGYSCWVPGARLVSRCPHSVAVSPLECVVLVSPREQNECKGGKPYMEEAAAVPLQTERAQWPHAAGRAFDAHANVIDATEVRKDWGWGRGRPADEQLQKKAFSINRFSCISKTSELVIFYRHPTSNQEFGLHISIYQKKYKKVNILTFHTKY